LTPELCVYDAKKYAQCRPWLEKHAPQHAVDAAAGLAAGVGGMSLGGAAGGGGGAEGGGPGAGEGSGAEGSGSAASAAAAAPPSAASAGGGSAAPPKAAAAAKPKVVVQVREDGKRLTTAISGLDPFCAKLKEAASALAKKVGAGATVRPHPQNPNISEVVVQVRSLRVPPHALFAALNGFV
jgi:translation initiation factor 1 (eIF-1/SUI1)